MKVIAIIESDDYSGAAIVDPSYITITKISDFYIAATRCLFSDIPETSEISEEQANKLIENGVKCFDINEPIISVKSKKQKKQKKD